MFNQLAIWVVSHYLNSLSIFPSSEFIILPLMGYETLTRFFREADRESSDKMWSRLPVRRLSVGTAPAHTCYVISTTRLTRIRARQERGRRAYRERERDSDSERRNVTRRACFAVVVGRAAMPAASGSP